jgi:hypothetical protein
VLPLPPLLLPLVLPLLPPLLLPLLPPLLLPLLPPLLLLVVASIAPESADPLLLTLPKSKHAFPNAAYAARPASAR